MIKIKSVDFLRDTVLFGITAVLFLVANLMTLMSDGLWAPALNVVLVAIIFLNIAVLSDVIKNIRRDIALLIFVIAFDILLLGRVYVSWIGSYDRYPELLEAKGLPELFQALQIVALSFFCVYLAYRLAGPMFHKREAAMREKRVGSIGANPVVPILRQLSEIVLIISSIPFFYSLFQTAINVMRHGYLNSFTDTDNIPGVVSRLSMFFVPSFAVFLATLPNKKQIKLPFVIYGVYMVSSLFTGRRNTLVTEALMLLVYFVMRDSLLSKQKRKIRKRTVGIAGIFSLAAMFLLQEMALIRAGIAGAQHNIGEILVGFFDSQGASFRVIIQTVNNINLFSRSDSFQYLFYPFELFVHNNTFTRTVFGLTPIIEVQNTAFVETTHNFGHKLTYLVDPARYLSGGGFGTSYVAEAYVAYRILGVIAVSMMIGLVFRFFSSMMTRNWLVLTCSLIALKNFVYIPRNFAFLWVTNTFNITYFCFYGAIYLFALFLFYAGTHVRKPSRHRPTYALERSEIAEEQL